MLYERDTSDRAESAFSRRNFDSNERGMHLAQCLRLLVADEFHDGGHLNLACLWSVAPSASLGTYLPIAWL